MQKQNEQERPNAGIILKKTQFRNQIRRQWLDNYRNKRRMALLKTQQQIAEGDYSLNQPLQLLLPNLPQQEALQQLINYYRQRPVPVRNFFKYHIQQLSNSIKQINLTAFNFYIQLLSNMVIHFPQTKYQLTEYTLKKIVGQGIRLMRQQKALEHIILINLIEYILLVSDCFDKIDMILMDQICDILRVGLQYTDMYPEQEQFLNCYINILTIINNYLISTVNGLDQIQDQQNISQQDFRNLQYAKTNFIHKMFNYQSVNMKTIFKIFHYHPTSTNIIALTLRFLTNLTYYTNQMQILYQILQSNLQNLILCVLQTQLKNQTIIITLIRLFNNILVYKNYATQSQYIHLNLQLFIKKYSNYFKHQSHQIIRQFMEMVSNAIQYNQSSSQFINYLINKEYLDQIIMGLEYIDKDQLLQKSLVCMCFLLQANPQITKRKIRQYNFIFQRLMNQHDQDLANICHNLLQQAFRQQNQTQQINQLNNDHQMNQLNNNHHQQQPDVQI